MKRWLIILILLMLPKSAYAFEEVLSYAIRNEAGMFFAYIAEFSSGEYLITASYNNGKIRICSFDESDGMQMCDVLEFDGINGEVEIIESKNAQYLRCFGTVYEMLYDVFMPCEIAEYKSVIRIAEVKNGEINTYKNTIGAAHNLLNDLKKQKIYNYRFIDRRNALGDEALYSLRCIIAASADIMSFDVCNYDTDKLMRYVLNTHRNFYAVIENVKDEVRGNEEIMLADAAFIDCIVSELFNVTPHHPPVNELVEKGYCRSGSDYMYTPAFDVSFSTQICEIETVYDVGNGVYFVIFGDIYTENGKSVPEYSYIILKDTGEGYNILRLEMGAVMPSMHEVLKYAEGCDAKKYIWENELQNVAEPEKSIWIIISAITVLIAAAVMFLLKKR